MTASAITVSKNNITYHPFNEKCHYDQITSVSSTSCVSQQNESHPHYQNRNEKSSSLCIMPYIYDFSDNMTAMTNGISSTSGGAPVIEISKSPSKNDKNQNHNQHAQGVYREKDPNQHSARGSINISFRLDTWNDISIFVLFYEKNIFVDSHFRFEAIQNFKFDWGRNIWACLSSNKCRNRRKSCNKVHEKTIPLLG